MAGEDVDVGGDFANNVVSRAVGGPNLKQRKRAKNFAWLCQVRRLVILTNVSCASFWFPKDTGKKSQYPQRFPGPLRQLDPQTFVQKNATRL